MHYNGRIFKSSQINICFLSNRKIRENTRVGEFPVFLFLKRTVALKHLNPYFSIMKDSYFSFESFSLSSNIKKDLMISRIY